MVIYVRGWAGEEDFPIPPQIVENGNAFPAYDGEEFAVQFDYSWYGNDPTAAAYARVIWRDEDDNVISTTEWPLPATSGFVHAAYSAIAPAGVATGRLQFEGPDIGGPEDRPGRFMGVDRPDVRRVLITADSVPGTALLDGAVTPPKIAPEAVETGKLADGAVVPGKIGLPGVTDLDLAVETGFYYFGSTAANKPEPGDPSNGFVTTINTGVVKMQRANLGYQRTATTWIRYAGSSGVWLNWEPEGGDTGWTTLAGHLSSGYTGTLEGKLSAGNVEIRGAITGDFQVGNTYISPPLPAPFDALPVQPRGPGYIGGGGIAVATNGSGGLIITASKAGTYCGFNIRYSL